MALSSLLRVPHAGHGGDPRVFGEVARLAAERALDPAGEVCVAAGEAPMAYLTGWRMSLAAGLLHEPGATVAAVARQVGYGDAFAFSAAFKRVRGVSPQEHRVRATAPTA